MSAFSAEPTLLWRVTNPRGQMVEALAVPEGRACTLVLRVNGNARRATDYDDYDLLLAGAAALQHRLGRRPGWGVQRGMTKRVISASAFARQWKQNIKEEEHLVAAKVQQFSSLRRAECAATRKEMKSFGRSKQQIDDALRRINLSYRRRERDLHVSRFHSQRAARHNEEVEQSFLGWTPNWPISAIALRDKPSLQWWTDKVLGATDGALLTWLQLSHQPSVKRPAPNNEFPVGLPDFDEWMALETVQDRVNAIRQSHDGPLRKRLRNVLVPPGPGRPVAEIDAARLAEAKECRETLKVKFQQAKREAPSDYTYKIQVKEILAKEWSDCPDTTVSLVLNKVSGSKPSQLAVLVAARKFDLPESRVRAGRVKSSRPPRKRIKRVVLTHSGNIEDVEYGREKGRRGDKRRRGRGTDR